MSLHSLKHYLDNTALQEVVYCHHNGEKKKVLIKTEHFHDFLIFFFIAKPNFFLFYVLMPEYIKTLTCVHLKTVLKH